MVVAFVTNRAYTLSKERIPMNNPLTKLELIQLMTADLKVANARLEQITTELEIRTADIQEISEKITRGSVRGLPELNDLLKDLENHRARATELQREADLLLANYRMDLEAINRTP
jgi:hypothetical protein